MIKEDSDSQRSGYGSVREPREDGQELKGRKDGGREGRWQNSKQKTEQSNIEIWGKENIASTHVNEMER